MTIDATAQALAGEEAFPSVDAPISETTTTEDDDLSAAYDKLTADSPVEAAEPAAEAEVEAEATEVAEPEPEAPSDLPAALKAHWKAIPADARDAFVASQREMGRKAAEAGRLAQGLNPIRDVLVEASKQMPHLLGMKPEQVAQEVLQLARVSADFQTRPVETMLGLVKKHGLEKAMAQALAGQPITQDAREASALQNEIKTLKAQLSRISDPNYLREQVSAVTMQERATDEVTRFAQSAEHWADVEPHLPNIIPIAKARLGESASPSDVLKSAYDMALQIIKPDALAKVQAAPQAAVTDPKKAEAVLKAKSVNVSGQTSGKAREMTEDEIYAAAYERAQRK